MSFVHEPVLLNEVLEYLAVKENDNIIDGTVGGGGHSFELLKMSGPKGELWGFDQDINALMAAQEKLKPFGSRFHPINQPFQNINKHKYASRTLTPNRISAILVDCGVSSFQFSPEDDRGFSFGHDARLDMRFGPFNDLTASEIVNSYSLDSLTKIFRDYSEERRARMLAERIVSFRRNHEPIQTVNQLLTALGMSNFKGRIHPATKVFQALRMEVNNELGALSEGLPELASNLIAGGRMAVITFHSVEDRVVKRTFLQMCASGEYRLLTKHVIKPTRAEVLKNRRSRSAKLRVIEKVIK